MMTLREFITKINANEHYRIYQPNRDCLIFESYFKVHSPYYFDKRHNIYDFNKNYFENNKYCNDVYKVKKLDKETKAFLNRFGDYVVYHLECGSFKPYNITTTESGGCHLEEVQDEFRPDNDYLLCFNVFIIPKNEN